MITRQDLQDLLSHNPEGTGPVLSVYVNVDQSNAVNLNRGFEAALKSKLQVIERSLTSEMERQKFIPSARKVTTFLSEYEPDGKSLVCFVDVENELFWHRNLGLPLETAAHWETKPHIRPLLEARDEFERYGVVLTDRAKARLFSVFLGTVEEHKEAFAVAEVKKFNGSGGDQMRSQMQFQRKAHEHARWHLKHVVEMTDKMVVARGIDRLVLAGSHEVTAELKTLLTGPLKKALVGEIVLPIEASEQEILSASVLFQEQFERATEQDAVQVLLTAAAKKRRAVLGLEETLGALNEGRVSEVIYTESCQSKGYQCVECKSLFKEQSEKCLICSGEIEPVEDILEAILARVFGQGGEVEQVREEAAARLQELGQGIGAHLRF